MKRLALIASVILASGSFAYAQNMPSRAKLKEMCDSLEARTNRRLMVEGKISLEKALRRGNTVDIYFTRDASYYPWHQNDYDWFHDELVNEFNKIAKDFTLGEIYAHNNKLGTYLTHAIGNNGKPHTYKHSATDPRTRGGRFIRRSGARTYPKGLSDRFIAVWQSHGYFYDDKQDFWRWQRSPLFRTVEDMYTQSYVLPFLIPMLENAGAYVMTPRERDINPMEYVIDNDRSFSDTRTGMLRRCGIYRETGAWKDAGAGFADFKESYGFADLPFSAGTARQIKSQNSASATASWTPDIEERGEYAVYISYKTVPNSTTSAHYTVHHMGGITEFLVNQRRGGGTWIYLGTFEFDKGQEGYVTLDNSGPGEAVVTADAVRIGGGMGLMNRGGTVSGVKRYMEGALYSMPWAGADSLVTRAWSTEYIDEYSSRGAWTSWMKTSKNIPFDLSLAFHSDAGLTPCDSTIGTLAIYTRTSEGKVTFEDGRDRISSRLLCDFVQSQVVNDIRADFDPKWSRRGLWDKSYNESRTPGIPAMILELLSHQNFADMRFGLDPSFRFTVCRAVYKGILKTLSDFYNCPYVVQPLPVHNFSVQFAESGNALLKWEPTEDAKEPTAKPTGYLIYTRIDDGTFDSGVEVTSNSIERSLDEGHIYSFKIVAFNDGGCSFPSETLAIGRPCGSTASEVTIVNNFDRVSAPYWVESPGYAGFDSRFDSGVPYIRDISYIGECYEFRRSALYVDDDYPGFGATYTDRAGEIIAGNTFDYPYVHGKALMALGHPFSSMSREAFCSAPFNSGNIDLICGKQKTTKVGTGHVPDRYTVFPEELRTAIRMATDAGCNILVTGANIATDRPDSTATDTFIAETFGIKLASSFGTHTGKLANMPFYQKINPDVYCIECPDGINPIGRGARTWLRYTGSNISAAVTYKTDKYKSVSIGIPLETLKEEADREFVLKSVLDYFDRDTKPVNHR